MTERLHDFQKDTGELASFPKATAAIDKGNLTATNASGYAVAAADTPGYTVIGVSRENKAAGTADGDAQIEVLRGVFRFAVNGGITRAQAHAGRALYVYDANTVSLSPGTNGILAGKAFKYISNTEVWVAIRVLMPPAILTADADATYGTAERDLLNEIKNRLNNFGL